MDLTSLKTSEDIEEEKDIIPGQSVLNSGLYNMAIELAYLDKTKNGAISVTLHFINSTKQKFKTTEYVTSGDAKGNKNYHEKDGKKFYLPGFNQINNLCLLAVGLELGDLVPEQKVLQLYDYKQKKEVPQQKQVLMQLHGKQITLGIIKQVVNKQVKVGDEYVPTAETREENVLSKSFRHSDGKTVTEIKAQQEKATFKEEWEKTYTDVTVDKTTTVTQAPVTPKSTGVFGASAQPNAATKSPKSLFQQ